VILALRSSLLDSFGFRHGFSLRAGGVSVAPFASLNLGRAVGDQPEAVLENHRRFAAEVGYVAQALYEVSQVHGVHVERISDDPPEVVRQREADALVCGRPGAAIGVRTADCTPVLLADPHTGAVGAVHAGWRGTAKGVIEAAVAALCAEARAPRERLIAAVFPCIGTAAFEVGDDVAAQLAGAVGDDTVIQRGTGRPHADLAAAVGRLLRRAGLSPVRIQHVAGCTFADPGRFFSHRRDDGKTGRHLAAIVPRC